MSDDSCSRFLLSCYIKARVAVYIRAAKLVAVNRTECLTVLTTAILFISVHWGKQFLIMVSFLVKWCSDHFYLALGQRPSSALFLVHAGGSWHLRLKQTPRRAPSSSRTARKGTETPPKWRWVRSCCRAMQTTVESWAWGSCSSGWTLQPACLVGKPPSFKMINHRNKINPLQFVGEPY